MVVNRMAGRTYEDLGQYPVFPWVLSDYTSDTLDLSNRAVYRDLKKPMGAQSHAREARFRDKYNNYHGMGDMAGDMDMSILMGPACMYGTHYSNPGTVISYLMRMEPFMSYHVHLQDGRFDKPDRQIQSIAQTFQGCTADNNDTDVKELIPEYFYNPDILVNANQVDFGTTSKGVVLNDIALPPWARNSPERFIQLQRAALESEYVSAHLHHWIDLIFGVKQRPPFLDDGSGKFYVSTIGTACFGTIRWTIPKVTRRQHFASLPPFLCSMWTCLDGNTSHRCHFFCVPCEMNTV
jgi:hypothetical protein